MEKTYDTSIQDFLTMANTRARLRMTTLYAYAGHHKLLVAGTGNKVEDLGSVFIQNTAMVVLTSAQLQTL